LGEGTSGAGGAVDGGTNARYGGVGGSGGATGGQGYPNDTGAGGNYGGASGGSYTNSAVGAVRIIWPGTSRSFPSTNTGDL
jgi:hypothetical protein